MLTPEATELAKEAALIEDCGAAIELKPPPAASLNTRQLWAKPVGEGAVAVLLINASPHELDGFTLKLSALNISQPSAVRSSSSLAHAGG